MASKRMRQHGVMEPDQSDVPTDVSPAAPSRRDSLLGTRLGEYVVRQRIGVGGMGLVYRGEQPLIGKPVAIKVLRPDVSDQPQHMERLLAEARAVSAIRHRGIIDIFSFGRTPDGRQYFVMEYLEGVALDQLIEERGMLPPREALGLCEEILAALNAAHEAGVIHRDLKPSNIFLVKQATGGTYVKVLDFGLAKLGAEDARKQSSGDLVSGTPEYMAPEQIRGEPVSSKTDLYAFGVLVYEMLTGQLPFQARTTPELLVHHLEHAPLPPVEHQPELPPELSSLILLLLAKNPRERPSIADVRAAIRRILRALPRPGARARSHATLPAPEAAGGQAASSQVPTQQPEGARSLRGVIGVTLLLGLAMGGGTLALVNSGAFETPPPPADLGKLTPIAQPTPAPAPAPKVEPPAPPDDKAEPAQSRAKPSGTFTLITTPESDVFRGGHKLGKTPLFNVRLTEGTHLLRLRGPDGAVHVFSVPIKAGRNTAHRLILGELPVESR